MSWNSDYTALTFTPTSPYPANTDLRGYLNYYHILDMTGRSAYSYTSVSYQPVFKTIAE